MLPDAFKVMSPDVVVIVRAPESTMLPSRLRLAAVLMLPVAVIKPAVTILAPVTLAAEVMVPVAEINPPVSKLPPVMLAVAVT